MIFYRIPNIKKFCESIKVYHDISIKKDRNTKLFFGIAKQEKMKDGVICVLTDGDYFEGFTWGVPVKAIKNMIEIGELTELEPHEQAKLLLRALNEI